MKTQSSVAVPVRPRRWSTQVTLGALVLLGLLGGCGQKGPLTLPPAAAASAPAR